MVVVLSSICFCLNVASMSRYLPQVPAQMWPGVRSWCRCGAGNRRVLGVVQLRLALPDHLVDRRHLSHHVDNLAGSGPVPPCCGPVPPRRITWTTWLVVGQCHPAAGQCHPHREPLPPAALGTCSTPRAAARRSRGLALCSWRAAATPSLPSLAALIRRDTNTPVHR
jgi:hypothetical protein